MTTRFKSMLRVSGLLPLTSPALAHEGHGLAGASHWHAVDTWGFVAMAVVLVIAIWLSRGGKP